MDSVFFLFHLLLSLLFNLIIHSTSFSTILATHAAQRWILLRPCLLCFTLEGNSITKEVCMNNRSKYRSVEWRHLNIAPEEMNDASHVWPTVVTALRAVLPCSAFWISDRTQTSHSTRHRASAFAYIMSASPRQSHSSLPVSSLDETEAKRNSVALNPVLTKQHLPAFRTTLSLESDTSPKLD